MGPSLPARRRRSPCGRWAAMARAHAHVVEGFLLVVMATMVLPCGAADLHGEARVRLELVVTPAWRRSAACRRCRRPAAPPPAQRSLISARSPSSSSPRRRCGRRGSSASVMEAPSSSPRRRRAGADRLRRRAGRGARGQRITAVFSPMRNSSVASVVRAPAPRCANSITDARLMLSNRRMLGLVGTVGPDALEAESAPPRRRTAPSRKT